MKLRKLKEKDILHIVEWMKDPEINCFFRFDSSKVSEETVRSFVEEAQKQENDLHYACVDDEDEYLGTVSLKNVDKKNKTAEYAVSFRKCAQGTGAANYATQEILKEAFGTLGTNKVYLNVLETNERAIRFYKKLGFVSEGVFREHIIINGITHNLRWYAMLREEWKRGK